MDKVRVAVKYSLLAPVRHNGSDSCDRHACSNTNANFVYFIQQQKISPIG